VSEGPSPEIIHQAVADLLTAQQAVKEAHSSLLRAGEQYRYYFMKGGSCHGSDYCWCLAYQKEVQSSLGPQNQIAREAFLRRH